MSSSRSTQQGSISAVVPPLLAFQVFNVVGAAAIFGPVLPLVAAHLGATPAWLTSLASIGALSSPTQLAMASLVERWGYRTTLGCAWTGAIRGSVSSEKEGVRPARRHCLTRAGCRALLLWSDGAGLGERFGGEGGSGLVMREAGMVITGRNVCVAVVGRYLGALGLRVVVFR